MTHDEEVMVRYLLGELTETERVEFEDACFADDHYFDELLAIEAELTDDYVRSDLSGGRRELFEKRVLSTTEAKNDVEFARIITGTSATSTQAVLNRDRKRSNWRLAFRWLDFRHRAFQMSLAALALIFLAVALWLFWSTRQTRPHQEQSVQEPTPAGAKPQHSPQTPDQSAAPGSRAATTPNLPRQPDNRKTAPANDSPAIISLLVVPGFERSTGGANDLIITPQTQRVRLQFALEGDNYQDYSVILRSVEGKDIFARNGLKSRATSWGSAVTLELPSSSFLRGDFLLTLNGKTSRGEVEEVHKYFLSVTKK